MLDTKKIIQLGIGVAVGMIAYHFIQKALNKSALTGETAGFLGTTSGGSCGFYSGNVHVEIPCSGTVSGGQWDGYSADCSGTGLGGCNVIQPNGMVIPGTYDGGRLKPVRLSRY